MEEKQFTEVADENLQIPSKGFIKINSFLPSITLISFFRVL